MASAVGIGHVAGPEELPGRPSKTSTVVKEMGAALLQSCKPIQQIHQHLCAFHFYAHDMRRQVEAHHYCTHYNEDMHQCAIFDSNEANARLIGVEYIVSDKIFKSLPDDEKKLWHSHEYEVKGGILFMPGVPDVIEHQAMKTIAKTYGKVFHFLAVRSRRHAAHRPPQLMMAFTADNQLEPELVHDVEKRFNFVTAEKRRSRADLTGPDGGIHALADCWKEGQGFASSLRPVDACTK